jgi:Protein of unknown function (DUF3225)
MGLLEFGCHKEGRLEINKPQALAELTQAFRRYESALLSNQPEVLNDLFWKSPCTVRYGVAENLHGHSEIVNYRSQRARTGGAPQRTVTREIITTFGDDFGTTNIEYIRTQSGRHGRQSQTWVRTADGWRIVSAHVSLLAESD